MKKWSMADVFASLPTGFGKGFILKLFPRIPSLMNGKAGTVSFHLMVQGATKVLSDSPGLVE